MQNDYFSMEDGGGASAGKDGGAPGGEPHEDEQMEGESALLPKSILAGKKFDVGDEVVLEIVAMHDDEVEVKYAKEKPGEEDGGGREESEMGKAEGRLTSMAGPGMGGGY